MSEGTPSDLNSEQDLASIPMAQGGLSRLAIARLKGAGVPALPLLRRVGLTPEVIADPEERLIVRSQIKLLDEAAIALHDDCLGFTLARDFDPRALGLLYYVLASSRTLVEALLGGCAPALQDAMHRYSHMCTLCARMVAGVHCTTSHSRLPHSNTLESSKLADNLEWHAKAADQRKSAYVMEEPDIVFATRKQARDYAEVLRTVGGRSAHAAVVAVFESRDGS